MFQNYVVEVKKLKTGEFEHQIFWLFDEDADKAMLKAESKYHSVLSEAALSDALEHSAILFTSQGFPMKHECYIHEEENAEEIPETTT